MCFNNESIKFDLYFDANFICLSSISTHREREEDRVRKRLVCCVLSNFFFILLLSSIFSFSFFSCFHIVSFLLFLFRIPFWPNPLQSNSEWNINVECWYYYLLMAQFSHICFSIHVLLMSPIYLVYEWGTRARTCNHQQFTNEW